jgi:hypothetical protein
MSGGQGPNNNPVSIFGNHQICNISGKLRDPSYEVSYSSLDDIENTAIFGYYVDGLIPFNETTFDPNGDGIADPTDLNGDGFKEANALVYVMFVTDDKSIADLKKTISNY